MSEQLLVISTNSEKERDSRFFDYIFETVFGISEINVSKKLRGAEKARRSRRALVIKCSTRGRAFRVQRWSRNHSKVLIVPNFPIKASIKHRGNKKGKRGREASRYLWHVREKKKRARSSRWEETITPFTSSTSSSKGNFIKSSFGKVEGVVDEGEGEGEAKDKAEASVLGRLLWLTVPPISEARRGYNMVFRDKISATNLNGPVLSE